MFTKSPRVDTESRCQALPQSALGPKVTRVPAEKAEGWLVISETSSGLHDIKGEEEIHWAVQKLGHE